MMTIFVETVTKVRIHVENSAEIMYISGNENVEEITWNLKF